MRIAHLCNRRIVGHVENIRKISIGATTKTHSRLLFSSNSEGLSQMDPWPGFLPSSDRSVHYVCLITITVRTAAALFPNKKHDSHCTLYITIVYVFIDIRQVKDVAFSSCLTFNCTM